MPSKATPKKTAKKTTKRAVKKIVKGVLSKLMGEKRKSSTAKKAVAKPKKATAKKKKTAKKSTTKKTAAKMIAASSILLRIHRKTTVTRLALGSNLSPRHALFLRRTLLTPSVASKTVIPISRKWGMNGTAV